MIKAVRETYRIFTKTTDKYEFLEITSIKLFHGLTITKHNH